MDNFYQTRQPFNPYQNQSYTPPYNGTIISVKGQEGCNAFRMGANSSVLLLDEDNPIVWIVRTDGAAGYDIIFILDEQQPLKEKYTKKTRVD